MTLKSPPPKRMEVAKYTDSVIERNQENRVCRRRIGKSPVVNCSGSALLKEGQKHRIPFEFHSSSESEAFLFLPESSSTGYSLSTENVTPDGSEWRTSAESAVSRLNASTEDYLDSIVHTNNTFTSPSHSTIMNPSSTSVGIQTELLSRLSFEGCDHEYELKPFKIEELTGENPCSLSVMHSHADSSFDELNHNSSSRKPLSSTNNSAVASFQEKPSQFKESFETQHFAFSDYTNISNLPGGSNCRNQLENRTSCSIIVSQNRTDDPQKNPSPVSCERAFSTLHSIATLNFKLISVLQEYKSKMSGLPRDFDQLLLCCQMENLERQLLSELVSFLFVVGSASP